MNTSRLIAVLGIVSFIWLGAMPEASAEAPTIPPTINRVWPVGMKRGTTATFTIEGRNLAGGRQILFDAKGITAKVLSVADIPEPKRQIRINVDLAAAVPQGKKQEAKVEITVAPDVEPGLHWFRFQTALGTTDLAVLDVGALAEIAGRKQGEASGPAQPVDLPATLVGTIQQPGDLDKYEFSGKAGEELVFQVVAQPLGSELKSALVLADDSGKELATAGYQTREGDAVLTYKLPSEGKYTLSVTDRERGGGMDHYYRLNAGALPYLTGVFPLGVRAGQATTVKVSGMNLGGNTDVQVQPPAGVAAPTSVSSRHSKGKSSLDTGSDGWTTLPVQVQAPSGKPLNSLQVAVGTEPEGMEAEPNNSPANAQRLTIPTTVNGHIQSGTDSNKGSAETQADEDYFRFAARKGQNLTIEVAASRLGSPLDSLIEVLDTQGHPVPRATVRCLYQTSLTLADRDSRTPNYRLVSTSGFHENDYLVVGDEVDQISYIPDQPDADIDVKGYGGLRMAVLGTSPEAHTVNEPAYRAQVLPPGAQFPPNGLPVFHITYRNDDGGPSYGKDSRLDFVAPQDGDYIVRLKDVAGREGPDYAYQLSIHDPRPDFTLDAKPVNPNIPRGGRVPVMVTANRAPGYEGPIAIGVEGLPRWITARPATIPGGQDSATLILEASPDAPLNVNVAPMQIVGTGSAGSRKLVRKANMGLELQVASVIPPPDLVVTAQPEELLLEPGKTAKVTLRVARGNGFAGRVPCTIQNLPPGVRVVNIGLNGVLVPEGETNQTFTLKAEDWASSLEQPIYVVGQVESNSPTSHASAPILLKVRGKQMASSAKYPQ